MIAGKLDIFPTPLYPPFTQLARHLAAQPLLACMLLRLRTVLRLKLQLRGGTAFYFDETVIPVLLFGYLAAGGKARGAGIIAALLFLVVLHEMAHWLAGRCQGFRCRMVRMGLFEGYCRMSFTPDMQATLGHLVFVLAGVAAEFFVFASAKLLHQLDLWPAGGFFLGLYKGLTIYNLILIAVNLYPHDGSDGEKALSIVSKLRRGAQEIPNDPNEQ